MNVLIATTTATSTIFRFTDEAMNMINSDIQLDLFISSVVLMFLAFLITKMIFTSLIK